MAVTSRSQPRPEAVAGHRRGRRSVSTSCKIAMRRTIEFASLSRVSGPAQMSWHIMSSQKCLDKLTRYLRADQTLIGHEYRDGAGGPFCRCPVMLGQQNNLLLWLRYGCARHRTQRRVAQSNPLGASGALRCKDLLVSFAPRKATLVRIEGSVYHVVRRCPPHSPN